MAIITISRGTFSGGKALAESVAARLGYRCIAREALVTASRDYGVSLDEMSKALTDVPGTLERLGLARFRYLAFVQAELVRQVKDENAVYHGLGGHLLLRDLPHVLRVKVIADIEFRINAAMERADLTRPDAIKFIQNIDEKRDRWVKFLYHVDRNDISTYDLVINLKSISMSSACDIVCQSASLPEYQSSPESRKRLDDLVLATEVRARIAAANIIDDHDIKINADDGIITLEGRVRNLADADRVREAVRAMPEVRGINSKLQVQSYNAL